MIMELKGSQLSISADVYNKVERSTLCSYNEVALIGRYKIVPLLIKEAGKYKIWSMHYNGQME